MSGGLDALMLSEARAEVAVADHKASMLLAALGVAYGAVLGGLLAGDWTPSHMDSWGEPVWWVGAVLATLSVAAAAAAVWPRFTTKDSRDGIYYWGHVARYGDLEEFKRAMDKQLPQSQDRTRHQLWRLSRLVKRKYNLVRAAMILAGAAVAAFGTASLIGG